MAACMVGEEAESERNVRTLWLPIRRPGANRPAGGLGCLIMGRTRLPARGGNGAVGPLSAAMGAQGALSTGRARVRGGTRGRVPGGGARCGGSSHGGR